MEWWSSCERLWLRVAHAYTPSFTKACFIALTDALTQKRTRKQTTCIARWGHSREHENGQEMRIWYRLGPFMVPYIHRDRHGEIMSMYLGWKRWERNIHEVVACKLRVCSNMYRSRIFFLLHHKEKNASSITIAVL